MRPKKKFTPAQIFQSRLDEILNLKHPLIALTSAIDWSYFEEAFAPYYSEVRGRTGAPIRLIGWRPKVVTADLGYRGHNYQGTTEVQIVNYRTLKSKTRSVRKWLKRRAAIEPIFGRLKSDNRMSKNLALMAIVSMPCCVDVP